VTGRLLIRQRHQRPLSISDRRTPTHSRQGLTRIEVAELHARQEGRCAICGEPLPARFVVDHDHALAAAHGHDPKVGCRACVRGVIHYRCNKALGLFRDDAEALRRAAIYVTWRRPRATA
jgi:hypothetical protein